MTSFSDPNRIAGNGQQNHLHFQMDIISKKLDTRRLQLATSRKINAAEGNPAGFIIGRTLQARNRGLAAALNNVGDARSTLSIAEGGLGNILDILETMKEKATRAASGTLNDEQRQAFNNEILSLAAEIDDIVGETTFNNIGLLSGTNLSVQAGAETDDSVDIQVTGTSQDAAALGVSDGDINASTGAGASAAMSSIDAAISSVASSIAAIGSNLTRLSSKESTIVNSITNTEAARSRIMDADLARARMAALGLEMRQNATTSALAQANASHEAIVALVG